MGQIRPGPPEALTLALKKRLELDHFVETGTYLGNTAAWSAAHFATVTSIELSPAFHSSAQARFRDQPHIRVVCGESSQILAEIVPTLTRPVLFWLDAHWSGADTAGREAECPILAELAAINRSPVDHVILVDDANLFCAPPPRPHRADHWPCLSTIALALTQNYRRYMVLYEDVFIAVPMKERELLSTWLQNACAVTTVRPRFNWFCKRVGNALR